MLKSERRLTNRVASAVISAVMVLALLSAFTLGNPLKALAVNSQNVSTWAQLIEELGDSNVSIINVTQDIIMEDNLRIERPVTITTANGSALNGDRSYYIGLYDSEVKLENLTLTKLNGTDNQAVLYSEGVLDSCVISDSYVERGSIVAVIDGTIRNCLISNNHSDFWYNDGFDYSYYSSVLYLNGESVAYNNTVVENNVTECYVRIRDSRVIVANNVFWNSVNNGLYVNIYTDDRLDPVSSNNYFSHFSAYSSYSYPGFTPLGFDNDVDDDEFLPAPHFVQPTVIVGGVRDGESVFGLVPDGEEVISDFSLAAGSPLTDAGTDLVLDNCPYDILGNPRIMGESLDVGAYESNGSAYQPPSGSVFYVKPNGTGSGTSWSDAMGSVQEAVIKASRSTASEKAVLVAGGDYLIKGKNQLYKQANGKLGNIYGGIILAEGVSLYGGFSGNETGSLSDIIAGRSFEWIDYELVFTYPTNLIGARALVHYYTGNMGGPEETEQSADNYDYHTYECYADYDDCYYCNNSDRYTPPAEFDPNYFYGSQSYGKHSNFISFGTRIIGQVENFNVSSVVDGFNISKGYVISVKSPGGPIDSTPLELFNSVGGAGVLIRKGVALKNSIVSDCYEATSFYDYELCGGGVMSSGGVITSCLIENNISEINGGGVFLSDGILSDSVVRGNIAFNTGGGVVTAHGKRTFNPTFITNCEIYGNSAIGVSPPTTIVEWYGDDDWWRYELVVAHDALGDGGGIWMANNVIVDSCNIFENSAMNEGAGIYLENKNQEFPVGVVQNSLIMWNSGSGKSTSAVFMNDGLLLNNNFIGNFYPLNGTGGMTRNSIFWRNELLPASDLDISFSAVEGGYLDLNGTNINLNSDNIEIDGPNFIDPDNLDFHLTNLSPCVNSGDPATVLNHDYRNADMRPMGSGFDIGMYELFVEDEETSEPTSLPRPTFEPNPSFEPTLVPSPTRAPLPTWEPSTERPKERATPKPTSEPTEEPSATPIMTEEPSATPIMTEEPTEKPIIEETVTITEEPTEEAVPTDEPEIVPTDEPIVEEIQPEPPVEDDLIGLGLDDNPYDTTNIDPDPIKKPIPQTGMFNQNKALMAISLISLVSVGALVIVSRKRKFN